MSLTRDSEGTHGDAAWSVQIQTVLFGNDLALVRRSAQSFAAAVRSTPGEVKAILRYGDAGAEPVFSDSDIAVLNDEFNGILRVEYEFFGEDTGYARGHNVLAARSEEDFLLFVNPEVVMAPTCLHYLHQECGRAEVGIVEAKRIPIEHPKEYDPHTGKTSWVSGTCALMRRSLFEDLNGFDAETFFMYCEDIDLSWRVRQKKYLAVHQPAAVVFRDRRFTPHAEWKPIHAEPVHWALSELLLAYKWSREDLIPPLLSRWKRDGSDYLLDASERFRIRERDGVLPEQIDNRHVIGYFDRGRYAQHRYELVERRSHGR